jgi:hypothetical protein
VNKCYTASALFSKHKWIVFGVLDYVEEYDGQGIDRVGNFYVTTENFFPMSGNGWYTFGLLKDCQDRNIEFEPKYQVIASSELPADYFKNVLETIAALPIKNWKTCSNASRRNPIP